MIWEALLIYGKYNSLLKQIHDKVRNLLCLWIMVRIQEMISYNQNYLKVWNFSNLLFRLNTSSFLLVLVFCWFECMESIWDEISIELIIMSPLNEKPLMISRNLKSLERLKHKLDWWNQVCDSLIWKKWTEL